MTRRLDTATLLRSLRANWAIAYGAVTLPLFLGIFIPKLWVAIVCFLGGYILTAFARNGITESFSRSSLLVNTAAKSLFVSAAVMFLIVILCTDWLVPTVVHLKLYNSEIPFVTCLVVFPVTALMCLAALYLGLGSERILRSQARDGLYAGDHIGATLYYRESKYQVMVLLVVSVLLGAVEYWYYFARYINSDLNAPDRFFFNYMPVAMYLISLLFMRGRYATMRPLVQSIEDRHPGGASSTLVRFLIFDGDRLLLHQGTDLQWDTPAEMVISRSHSVGEPQARLLLSEQTGLNDFTLRYCYTNESFASSPNIVHYAAFVGDDMKESFAHEDQWFDAYMLDKALAANRLAPLLANELYRIHTITMAWKTYNRDGRRLYPIKNYRPTFRFSDMAKWDVDYDDASWFDVAHNNEDRHFFKTRQLWNRITGIFRRRRIA